MAQSALALKEQGNRQFQLGNFKEAEVHYTRAIQKDSSNPILWRNRAFARVKLKAWEGCVDDCLKSIGLERDNMKAYYYLAQAQLGLKHPNEALQSALTAYELCIKSHDSSGSNICAFVLQAKKEKWEKKERERLRRSNELLGELEDSLRRKENQMLNEIEWRRDNGMLSDTEATEQTEEITTSTRRKLDELVNVFAISSSDTMQRREVPDYLIDTISFSIMLDPVITKSGRTYERTVLLEHLRRSETDPLTRDPLRREDLRPNLALKEASAKFLEENGWAVDW